MRIPSAHEPNPAHLKALYQTLCGSDARNGSSTIYQHTGVSYRTIEELLDALDKCSTQDISSVEWSLLLRYHDRWGHQSYQNVVEVCQYNHTLSQKLLALFLKVGGQPNSSMFCKEISRHKLKLKSISEAWSIVLGIWLNDKGFAETFLKGLVDKPEFRKKHFSQKHMNSKNAWLWKRIGKKRIVATLFNHAAFKVNEQANIDYVVKWFADCLNEVYRQDMNYAVSIVQYLADQLFYKKRVNKRLAEKLRALAPWLDRHIFISSNKQVWQSLSASQREVFTVIMGEETYGEFKEVIQQLAKMRSKTERNQLEKRSGFWEGYKHHFLTFRVFASGSDYDYLSASGIEVKQFISSEDTVVCVMETEKWIVMDFLSGRNSEVRVYPYSYSHNLLGASLSHKAIGRMKSKLVHDHRSYWQWSLWAMLKDIDLIGINKVWSNALKPEAIEAREKDLKRWKKEFHAPTIEFDRLMEYLDKIKE